MRIGIEPLHESIITVTSKTLRIFRNSRSFIIEKKLLSSCCCNRTTRDVQNDFLDGSARAQNWSRDGEEDLVLRSVVQLEEHPRFSPVSPFIVQIETRKARGGDALIHLPSEALGTVAVDEVVGRFVVDEGLANIFSSAEVGPGKGTVQRAHQADSQTSLVEDLVLFLGSVIENGLSEIAFTLELNLAIESVLVLIGIIEPPEEFRVASIRMMSHDGGRESRGPHWRGRVSSERHSDQAKQS